MKRLWTSDSGILKVSIVFLVQKGSEQSTRPDSFARLGKTKIRVLMQHLESGACLPRITVLSKFSVLS